MNVAILAKAVATAKLYGAVTVLTMAASLCWDAAACRSSEQPTEKPGSLTILTSFSPDFYTPFIEAFQRRYPEVQLLILNKKTTAAITEILRGNTRHFDLFWTSSPDALAVLKAADRLRHSGYQPKYPPLSTENTVAGDLDGLYFHFALSGVGFMWNSDLIAAAGLKPPTSWHDLADQRYYGLLAMSTPSRSGTNHLIVESLLQGMGWDAGWRFLLQIAGNMETLTARSFSVPEGVASGRFGAGPVIDFLAMGKMHDLDNIGFSYGEPIFLMPASIASLKGGENEREAVTFIDFLLSRQGQEILLSPAINRLPVSREAFDNSSAAPLPPLISFIQQGKTIPYDTELSRKRYALVNTLFDQVVTYHFLERRKIWKRTAALAKRPNSEHHVSDMTLPVNILDTVCTVPVSEADSRSDALNALFATESLTSQQAEKRRALLRHWEHFVIEALDQAGAILDEATRASASPLTSTDPSAP